MRRLAACLLLVGCRHPAPPIADPPQPPPVSEPAPPAPPAPAPPVDVDAPGDVETEAEAAPPPPPAVKPPEITPAQRAAFARALKAGRALAHKQKWADAVRKFDEALVAIPHEERALSELSWAAFQTGDWARALPAATEAVAAATDPLVRAASLYNLGRVYEAMGRADDATRAYQESLALRASPTVTERLGGLGKTAAPGFGLVPIAGDCIEPRPRKQICACLEQAWVSFADDADGDGAPDDEIRCVETRTKLPAGVDAFIARVEINQTEAMWYLAGKQAAGWSVIAQIGRRYTPGAFGIDESFAIKHIELRTAGARQVLWIPTATDRSDRDTGINEEEFLSTEDVVLCPLPTSDGAPISCPLELRLREEYSRDRFMPEDPEDPSDRYDHTKGLPIFRKSALDVRIADDGTVSVVLRSGTRSDSIAHFLGNHRLW